MVIGFGKWSGILVKLLNWDCFFFVYLWNGPESHKIEDYMGILGPGWHYKCRHGYLI